MKDDLDRIQWFLPTLRREIDAFIETRTKHDQQRVVKAIGHLEDILADMLKEVMNVQLRREDE